MTVTDLDSDIWDPRGNSLSKVVSTYWPVNKRSAYQPLDWDPTSVMYLLSLVFFFLQPPKPNHRVGSACSRLPWLAAPPPPYRTYPPTLASSPSIPPHVLLFSGDISPNTHPCPNQSILILPSACDWTGASSTAPVRSVWGLTVVLRLAALVCSPCAVRCPLALSTSSTTERNKEMTVRGEDDSRDPPASWQYASKCLYSKSPKIWLLLMVGHLGFTPLSM